MSLFGDLFSAFGSYKAGKDQSRALRLQARSERQAAEFDAKQFQKTESAKLASARAIRAGSGVSFTGSALMVDRATVQEAALQAENIKRGGEVRARQLRNEARLAKSSGKRQAFATLLSGASSFGQSPAPVVDKSTGVG